MPNRNVVSRRSWCFVVFLIKTFGIIHASSSTSFSNRLSASNTFFSSNPPEIYSSAPSAPFRSILFQPWNMILAAAQADPIPSTALFSLAETVTDIVREGAINAATDLNSLRGLVSIAGKSALTREAMRLKESAERAVAASSIVGGKVKGAVQELESVSDAVESRISNAAVEAIKKLKNETSSVVTTSGSILAKGAAVLQNNAGRLFQPGKSAELLTDRNNHPDTLADLGAKTAAMVGHLGQNLLARGGVPTTALITEKPAAESSWVTDTLPSIQQLRPPDRSRRRLLGGRRKKVGGGRKRHRP